MKQLIFIFTIILLASCDKEEIKPMEKESQQTENTKAAHTPDITGTWNMITDNHLALRQVINIEWIDGVLMLNKTTPLLLVTIDEVKSVDPLLMIQGKMDANTMRFQELVSDQQGGHTLIHLDYVR